MSLSVRTAHAADDQAIGELLVDAFVVAYGTKLAKTHTVTEPRKADLRNVARKREHGHVLVAEREGQIVGTVTVYPPGSPDAKTWLPDAADLRYLAISSALHGKGLSKAVMDAAEAWCRKIGARYVTLNVRAGVDGVARLYLSRGYLRDPRGDRLENGDVQLDGYCLTL
jgi:GNAT superfamily N-acetyltransferase